MVKIHDSVDSIVYQFYQNLTTVDEVISTSHLNYPWHTIFQSSILNIPVKCFCGDPSVSLAYGLFATHVVQATDKLTSLVTKFDASADDISRYNSGANFLVSFSTIFIPKRDVNGLFPPFIDNSSGNSTSTDTGSSNLDIIAGVVVGVLVLAIAFSFMAYFERKYLRLWKLANEHEQLETASSHWASTSHTGSSASTASIIIADLKSVEFSYEELVAATSNK